MRRQVALGLCLLLAALPLSAAGPKILLVARDLEEKPLPGLRFAYAGVESKKTTPAGATELDLPPGHQEGRQIKLLLLQSAKKSEVWFLVNPQINIPIGSVPAELVLMRRSAFRKLADTAREAAGPTAGSQELTAEDKKRALVETAAGYGLKAEQVETALRSFAETQDSTDQGIAAYLEGRFSQAEELLQSAAKKNESNLVETLQYLGSSQHEQAKYPLAAATFRKALGLRPDDSGLLISLGRSLFALADWVEAEPLTRRALKVDEESYGPDHPDIARDLIMLAQLLKATNRLVEAEPLLLRALAIDETSHGAGHPEVARDLNALAQLLQATNRIAEAEQLKRRALAIDEKSYGPNHPDVARDLNNLALLLRATNRTGEAEPLMRRSLAIDEMSYGPNHPKVAICLNNLAFLLHSVNRFSEAEPLMRRALAIDENTYGRDHPDVARDLNNLAQLLQATDRLAEAEPLMRRHVEIFVNFTRRTGHEHPNLRDAFVNYSVLLRKMGKSPAEVEAAIENLKTGTNP